MELLKAAARQRLAAGQGEFDLGLDTAGPGGPLPITASRMGHLLDALAHAYRVLGFEGAAGEDAVFRDLVLARIIEPASKADSARVLEEAGVAPASYPTVNRRLRVYAKESWRQKLSAACARHAGLGPASLVLYDVSTLYFETDEGDGFRESGFSKERRLEPQITIGLLTGQDGFPLMVSAFEGNKAETKTMLPVIESFMAAHQIPDVTVVADAGMVSEANQKAIESSAGLSFILGMKIPRRTRCRRWWAGGRGSGRWPRTAPVGSRRHVLEGQNTRGPSSDTTAGTRVSPAIRVTATAMASAGPNRAQHAEGGQQQRQERGDDHPRR